MAMVLIRDGYTLKGKFGPTHNLPQIDYSYRPAVAIRYQEFYASKREKPADLVKETVKLIAEHLVAWDILESAGGPPAAINEANLNAVPWPILDKIASDVLCWVSSGKSEEDAKN